MDTTDPTDTHARGQDQPGHEEVVTDAPRLPRISWGAVFAGFVFVIAGGWLLYTLGLAIGVSILDASDAGALGNGLSTGTVIWIVVSSLIMFFLGSLLAARLAGEPSNTVGIFHGITVWSLSTTVTLILAGLGISAIAQAGYAVTKDTVSMAATATADVSSGAASAAQGISSGVASLADSALGNNIQASLKRAAAKAVAAGDAQGGPSVSQSEIRKSIDQLDSKTLQQITGDIIAGNTQQAKQTLADNTALNQKQVNDLIQSVSQEIQEKAGTAGNQAGLMQDAQNAFNEKAAGIVAGLDAKGGAKVSQSEVKNAMNDLTPEVLASVAGKLISGEPQAAKDVLATNTSLSDAQIQEIVDGVQSEVQSSIDKYQKQASEAVEAASDYAQALTWTAFVAGALGLVVSILGGMLGSETSRRLYVDVQHHKA